MPKIVNELKTNVKKLTQRKDFIFIVVSVIFAVILSDIKKGQDDVTLSSMIGDTPQMWFDWVYTSYFSWSSRVIVNYIFAVLLNVGKIVWMAYMGISMFVMLKAFEMLFFTDDNELNSLFAVCIMCLFPFKHLVSAGWIATCATYFGPIAFGMICLVPIRHALEGKKEKILSFLFYCISLIYGANEEMMLVVIFLSYFTAMIYLSLKKKVNWQIIVLSLLCILSLIFTLTCPGNSNRGIREQAKFFPTFDMLDVIDKAELGWSTTIKWLLIDNNAFLIFTLCMMSWLIWRKYSETVFRVISLIPVAATLICGTFSDSLGKLFPFTIAFSYDIGFYGSFTPINPELRRVVFQFAFFLMVVFCIVAELMLLHNKVEGFIADIVLIAAGTASRVAMGFSPTIYASGVRTFVPFIVCIIAVSVHIWCENKDTICNDSKAVNGIKSIMWLLIIWGLLTLTMAVALAYR